MAKRPAVPKFGTWEGDNVGYTAYFDKVRENKGATAPPMHRPFNPNDPEEGPMMFVPPAAASSSSSRPATSAGHRDREQQQRRPSDGQGGHHRRAGSTSSAASSEQSKFAPPPQWNPRPSPQPTPVAQHIGGHQQHRGAGAGGQYQQQPPAVLGGGGHRAQPQHAQRQHHHHAAPAQRARSASPQSNAPGRQRPSTVPKFGVWDEQTAAAAAEGFTVQFENVKRHRQVARGAVPAVPRAPSPPEGGAARRAHHHHHQKAPFVSKMFGCFLPTAKE
ncbi:unnamed protein product [Urochloa decumbens]|uniref:RIN4 pathogenic type III effector avirulence factor Avr cleavage site domain-containing protein n=1 Tax=Urochloa decumbens TaxID=240449 RepID=A0ABC9DNJ5_9POAL